MSLLLIQGSLSSKEHLAKSGEVLVVLFWGRSAAPDIQWLDVWDAVKYPRGLECHHNKGI